jgi:hypothetical protein
VALQHTLCYRPTRRNRALDCPDLYEVLRPSGDITSRVRFTRDYHPRHLPPVSFLNSSTDFSSAWLACRVSYRHHLWDSKLKEHGESSSVFDSRVQEGALKILPPESANRRTTQTARGRLHYGYVSVNRLPSAPGPTIVLLDTVNASLT